MNTKRCYMLVHSVHATHTHNRRHTHTHQPWPPLQMKRCSTPSFLALTHDARWLPFLRPDTEAEKVALQPLTTLPKADVAASSDNESVTRQGHFLLYDRILADVPCSGDGTVRKAPTIWRNWTPNMVHLCSHRHALFCLFLTLARRPPAHSPTRCTFCSAASRFERQPCSRLAVAWCTLHAP